MQQIANRIKQAKNVLICTHMRPDGDAFGSAFSLACALEYLGISYEICVESVPQTLSFVPNIQSVKKFPSKEYDLLIAVDCSDVARLGILADEILRARRKKIEVINIDHHVSNTRFAKYNFVRECAANCMHVCALIEYMGAPIDKLTAEYLLTGLLTDSGNFSHDDVTEETMLLAAKLLKAGADICHYTYMLFKRQAKARAALYARTMSGMRFYHDNRFAVIVVSQKNMEEFGADSGMTEGFVDFPLNVDTVEVAASLLEVKKGQYKISLRSKTYVDVNRLAGCYGGGGHVRAAGCMLFGDLEDVLDRLSYTVSQYLE
jgi:phosphoesterase RecJ-like protein